MVLREIVIGISLCLLLSGWPAPPSSRGRFASQVKSVPPMFRATARRNSLLSPLRNPVEMSFCMESMLPYHTATASALMTSMLSLSGSLTILTSLVMSPPSLVMNPASCT